MKEEIMGNGQIVYTNGNLTDSDEEVSLGQHTRILYIANNDGADWVEVRLNGGPHSVFVPPSGDCKHYIEVPGDYPKVQVVTASSAVRLYAVG
jgi:hypothetical protein